MKFLRLGFTLIEVIITLAIIGSILVLALAGIQGGLKSQQNAKFDMASSVIAKKMCEEVTSKWQYPDRETLIAEPFPFPEADTEPPRVTVFMDQDFAVIDEDVTINFRPIYAVTLVSKFFDEHLAVLEVLIAKPALASSENQEMRIYTQLIRERN